jgi:serine/threonine-protein kinase
MGRTERLADRYRLIERLGSGGMSVVWRAYDETLGRQVAVKVLSPRLAGDRTFRERLRQEALAAARLSHPNITGIFDFGESPLSERLTVPYVVMELIDGESVSARLRRQGPLPWREAVVIGAEVASALATAHARGVVHRDVTPANVMLTGSGAKVVDFGISALIGQRDTAPDGSLLGTPAYLAPERLGGTQVLPATDMYALGLLLYRMVTARLPWPAENTTEALRAHLYADPEPLPDLPGLPAAVIDLCMRCLAKNPDDRPAAAEVTATLAAVAGPHPIVPPTPARSAGPPVRATAAAHTDRGPVAPAQPRRAGWSGKALGYLGLPGGVPSPGADVRRLRAALRIGSVLRVGGVKPIGGGVFVGGHLARDVLTGGRVGRSMFAGRHRVHAAIGTLTLLAVVGLAWSTSREPAEVGTAQAAAAGTGPLIPARTDPGCRVRYQVRHDSGADFEALLTLSNIGTHALSGWLLEFAYPGTQRLTAADRRVHQRGRAVRVPGLPDLRLGPGRSITVTLRGAYRNTNPLPLSFRLNGHTCRSVVLGATSTPPAAGTGAGEQTSTSRGATSARGGSAATETGAGVRGGHAGGPHRVEKSRINKTGDRTVRPKRHRHRPAPPPGKAGAYSVAV